MSRFPKQAKILGALIAVGFAVPAVACQPGPKDWSLTINNMSKSADLIVKGRLVRGTQSDQSIISLRVDETIKGPVREQWTLRFPGFHPHRHAPGLSENRGSSDSSASNRETFSSVIVGARMKKFTKLFSKSAAPEYQVMGTNWPQCGVAFFIRNSQMLEMRLKIAFAGLGGIQAKERDFLLREEFGNGSSPWPRKSLEHLIAQSMWRLRRLDLSGGGVTLEDIQDVMTIIEAPRPYRGGEFRFFDLNGNGSITENEITRALRYTAATSRPYYTRARAQSQWKRIWRFDADGDDMILLSELPPEPPQQPRSFRRKESEDRRRRLQSVVRVFDENGDGVVSEPEFVNQLKEAFRFYDRNDNGIADDFD